MIPTLTYPWAFLLFLLVPFLAWRFARQSRGAWQFSDRRLLPVIAGGRARWAWWGGLLLRLAGLLLFILALSGPPALDR